jgi:hypothetical protein
MTEQQAGGEGGGLNVQLRRAYRQLNRALERFYEKKYQESVELCGEALGHLLPDGDSPILSPEEKADLFLKTYSAILPVHGGDEIAGVFTFFQDRRARFRLGREGSFHNRDWWQLIQVQRGEADGAIRVTREALGSLEQLLPQEE